MSLDSSSVRPGENDNSLLGSEFITVFSAVGEFNMFKSIELKDCSLVCDDSVSRTEYTLIGAGVSVASVATAALDDLSPLDAPLFPDNA